MRGPVFGVRVCGTASGRITEDIRARILTGDLTGRLPTRPELASHYGVSVSTIGTALNALTAEGLLLRARPLR